jgi:hypothetical protein
MILGLSLFSMAMPKCTAWEIAGVDYRLHENDFIKTIACLLDIWYCFTLQVYVIQYPYSHAIFASVVSRIVDPYG